MERRSSTHRIININAGYRRQLKFRNMPQGQLTGIKGVFAFRISKTVDGAVFSPLPEDKKSQKLC